LSIAGFAIGCIATYISRMARNLKMFKAVFLNRMGNNLAQCGSGTGSGSRLSHHTGRKNWQIYLPSFSSTGSNFFILLPIQSEHNNQCCASGMFIPDPDFYPSRIPDLGSRIPDPKTGRKERVKKKFCQTFFCSHKFNKM
jgi:hypothetical protein